MHYEQVTYSGGRIDHIHILYAGAEVIGQYITTNQSGVPPASTRYFGTDPLGSVVVLTNETGVVTDRYAYDPWGKKNVISGSSDSTDTGFTGQEQLAVGLVQLNGRLYDPVLGRMVSADPIIANTHDLQSYNGYSYVMNNPLGMTDPSGNFSLGHFFKSLFKFSVNPSPRNTFNQKSGSTIEFVDDARQLEA